LEKPFDGLNADEAARAYGESLVATSRLLELGGPSTAFNLLTDVASGIPFSDAFARAVLVPYDEFAKSIGF
jgi:hypothetical protein